MEYPGYSISKSKASSESGVLNEAENLILYLQKKLFISPERLILIGRSIGSGPASYLVSRFPIAGLVLISGFVSIKRVAKDMFGKIGALLIKERFENKKWLESSQTPLLLIHGRNDKIIPCKHSKEIYRKINFSLGSVPAYCRIVLPKNMNHCQLSYKNHVLEPLKGFLEKIRFTIGRENSFSFPKKLFHPA